MMKGNTYMKFDIAQAWKDETYRQTLSQEQLNTLPANPAGELNDAELTLVCGGGGFGGFEEGELGAAGGSASSSSSSRSLSSEFRLHSFSLICDINIFSVEDHVVGLDHLINIAQCKKQVCINND